MKIWQYFAIVFFGLILVLFFTRLILPSQIDDVSSEILCEEKLLNWADVYYVIPKFENISIGKEWCDEILNRNKELALHGFYHSFEEFGKVRDLEYFEEGVEIFNECFGFEPTRFKPPQLAWTKENDWIKDKMEVDLIWNQIFHKVYHCGDTGFFPNWFIRIF